MSIDTGNAFGERSFVDEAMERIMDTILKLYGASLACVLLIVGVISAYANTGRDQGASIAITESKSVGEQVALNPQPLPPRQTPRARQFRKR
jgi:hypothetical protein